MSSAGNKAVFLSYASQDTEAAKRIAEALRAAGVEVWFDQSELVGGDAWDQKIRRQIGSCALFMPLISPATNARAEGYFRLEWKLAVDRSHLMADDAPFLFPIVIGEVEDAAARVPDKFREVQWTRLPGGEATPAFCARVSKLLHAGGVAENPADAPAAAQSAPAGPTTRRKSAWMGYGWAAVGIGFALFYALRPMFQEPRPKREKTSVEPAPVTEARRLTQQAKELITKTGRGSSKWEAAALLCERALDLDPTDAEAHALASQVDSRLWFHVFDRTPRRSESARSRAARALNLAPASFESRLAQATFLVLVAGRPQSEQAESVLRQLRLEAPSDPRPVNLLGSLMMALERNEESLALNDDEARIPGNEAFGLMQKAWNLHRLRRVAEMGIALDRSIELQPIAGSVTLRVYYDLGWWGDRDRALASLNRLPAEELAEDNGISAAVRVHRWRRDPEALLRFLGTVPRDWIWWGIRGPKAALTGDAHASSGRKIAAQTDWRSALALVDRRLAEAPNDQNLLEWKAYLHARLGDLIAARDAYQRSLEFVPAERGLLEIEKLGYIAPADEALSELERRAESTVADMEAKRRMSARFISAADLRLNPAWDPVRSHPRFQALLAKLDADPRFYPTVRPAPPSAAKADDKSVAVLAFANLSSDKEQEYFSDGISEELLNLLAKVPGLKVSARTSAFHFKNKNTPIPEIAKQLGVAYVVEGSVRRQGNRVRITAQLIKAADGFHVWSDTFTRDLKDIFAVQDEIAGLIAQQLQLKLGGSSRATKQVNPEAYRLVLEGRHFWLLRTGEGFARAEAAFNRALALDPDFAEAHAGLADVWSIRAWYRLLGGEPDAADDLNRGDAEAQIALRLDPSLAEPHAALGAVRYNQRRYAESEKHYQEALRLNPNYAFAHHWRAQLRGNQGHLDESMTGMAKSIEMDPLAFITLTSHTLFLAFAGRYEEAIELSDRALALRREIFIPLYGNRALLMLGVGRTDEAVAAARTVLENPRIEPRWWLDANAIYVLRRTGFATEAQAHAGRIRAGLPERSQLHAAICAAVGLPQEAVGLLAANGIGSTSISAVFYSEIWDEARATPQFLEVITRLGFEADYLTARETLVRMKKEQGTKR